MTIRTIENNELLSQKIRERRNKLNLSIEAAAKTANMSTKTWCRYEAGEPIREDKVKGLLKALKILSLSALTEEDSKPNSEIIKEQWENSDLYKAIKDCKANNPLWSQFIEDTYGEYAAFLLAIGMDFLESLIDESLANLSDKPKGTHLGEVYTHLVEILPTQFLTRYDYEFLYYLWHKACYLKQTLESGEEFTINNTTEEILLYKATIEAEQMLGIPELEKFKYLGTKIYWYNHFSENFLEFWRALYVSGTAHDSSVYTTCYVSEDSPFHFNNWKTDYAELRKQHGNLICEKRKNNYTSQEETQAEFKRHENYLK